MDPNARMKIKQPKTPSKVSDAEIPFSVPIVQPAPNITEGILEADPNVRDLPPGEPGEVQPSEILTDVDFEKFYLNGTVEYTFLLNKTLPVVLRLLTSSELLEVNEFLWKSTKEDRSVNVVMLEYSILLLSHCTVKYGEKKLHALPLAEREKFFRSISGLIINVLSRKYTILEESVTRYFSDTENIKN